MTNKQLSKLRSYIVKTMNREYKKDQSPFNAVVLALSKIIREIDYIVLESNKKNEGSK
jgi:hypothetical protein